jgi:hypothetical protein
VSNGGEQTQNGFGKKDAYRFRRIGSEEIDVAPQNRYSRSLLILLGAAQGHDSVR